MTETRKKIIELIEPYMDKTLREGCLLIKNNELYRFIGHTSGEEIYVSKIIKSNNFNGCDFVYREDYQILGHYDITAVLKYIIDKQGVILNNPNTFGIHCRYSKKHYGFIYNKPLHLYTEQEDKDLLELLLKLK